MADTLPEPRRPAKSEDAISTSQQMSPKGSISISDAANVRKSTNSKDSKDSGRSPGRKGTKDSKDSKDKGTESARESDSSVSPESQRSDSPKKKKSKPKALDPKEGLPPEKIGNALDWQPTPAPATTTVPVATGWGCCSVTRTQTEVISVIDTTGVESELHTAEQQQTKELKALMEEILAFNLREVQKAMKHQNKNLKQAMADLQVQLQDMKEELKSSSNEAVASVKDLADGIEKIIQDQNNDRKKSRGLVAGKVRSAGKFENLKGIPGMGDGPDKSGTTIVAGTPVDGGEFDTTEIADDSANDTGNDDDFPFGRSTTPEEEDARKTRMARKTQSAKRGKKLKLDRDDDDTSLYLVAEKVDVQAKVEQEIAKLTQMLKLTEVWRERVAPRESSNKITALVNHRAFSSVVNVVIFLNVVVIAIQAEHAVNRAHEGKEASGLFILADLVFCAIFCTEITLRLLGDRIIFVVGPDAKWNIMDASFVALDVVNQIFLLALQGVDISYVSSFRTGVKMIRLARTARALRMFRVIRNSTRARLLFEETVASISLGFWLCCVLFVALSFFGLFFMAAAVDVLLGKDQHGFGDDLQQAVLDKFSSSPEAIFSLFQLVCGGMPWGYTFKELMAVDSFYGIMFMGFVFLTMVLLLNVVVGVFVDSAVRRSKKVEVENKFDEADRFKKMLIKAELGKVDGLLSKQEFVDFLKTPFGAEQLMIIGLEVAEALGVYELIDAQGKGDISIDDLSSACCRFTQPVRCADNLSLLLALKKITKEQRSVAKFIQNRFNSMVTLVEAAFLGG